jgi:DNA repair protein RadC
MPHAHNDPMPPAGAPARSPRTGASPVTGASAAPARRGPIACWPARQRPRERLLLLGAEPLADAELLAVLLRSGPAGSDAVQLAQAALAEFGGWHPLLAAERDTFCARRGLGPAQWAALQAAKEIVRRSALEQLDGRQALTSPAEVRRFLTLWLRDRPAESFVGLFVDSQHRVITALELFRGTLSQTAVYPREVARQALRLNAAAVIFAHNHPSGVAEPSTADRLLTDTLRGALAQIDVGVLDHLIVAGNRCVSFAERGWL